MFFTLQSWELLVNLVCLHFEIRWRWAQIHSPMNLCVWGLLRFQTLSIWPEVLNPLGLGSLFVKTSKWISLDCFKTGFLSCILLNQTHLDLNINSVERSSLTQKSRFTPFFFVCLFLKHLTSWAVLLFISFSLRHRDQKHFTTFGNAMKSAPSIPSQLWRVHRECWGLW